MDRAPLTLSDVEARALERLDPDWAGYFQGGAEEERTLDWNRSAFDAWAIRQRVLTGIGEPDTTTTLLGHPVAHPVVVAPVAYQRMAHPDGEVGMAEAAAATGGALCLSTFSIDEPAAVAAAAPDGLRFLQLYVLRDRGISDELVAQAVDLGYRAIVLTVDLPVAGPRDRERRVHWTFPDDAIAAIRYAYGRGLTGVGLEVLDAGLDWSYLEHLVGTARVPVVVKGVMEPDDARRAADRGASGVVVSNHGGRQLDRTPATLDVLPEIVDAVGDRIEIWIDGGVRRGTDVLVCLARGARAVLAGRQPLWGLAAAGRDGARTVLELMTEELRIAMLLSGCAELSDIGPHVLRRRS